MVPSRGPLCAYWHTYRYAPAALAGTAGLRLLLPLKPAVPPPSLALHPIVPLLFRQVTLPPKHPEYELLLSCRASTTAANITLHPWLIFG